MIRLGQGLLNPGSPQITFEKPSGLLKHTQPASRCADSALQGASKVTYLKSPSGSSEAEAWRGLQPVVGWVVLGWVPGGGTRGDKESPACASSLRTMALSEGRAGGSCFCGEGGGGCRQTCRQMSLTFGQLGSSWS